MVDFNNLVVIRFAFVHRLTIDNNTGVVRQLLYLQGCSSRFTRRLADGSFGFHEQVGSHHGTTSAQNSALL